MVWKHFIFKMRPFQFNPYDSNTWEGMSASNSPMPNDSFLYNESDFQQNAQPLPYQYTQAPPYVPETQPSPDYSDYSSSTTPLASPPHCIQNADCRSLLLTDLKNFKTALAARSGYNGPQYHRQWVKQQLRGFICLPLSCLGYIREPHGEHKYNPKVIIYHPLTDHDIAQDSCYFPNFTGCLEYLEKINAPEQ